MTMRILTSGAMALLCAGLAIAHPGRDSGLIVHEWGTFLAMHGSDGISLDGMYHEEHALPAFVHARSREQLRLRSALVKGETPVIYFYAGRRARVEVMVDFPGGIWTQWYPQVVGVRPSFAQVAMPLRARNGRIAWTVDVVPPAEIQPQLPATDADALWNHAREVDAAYVRAVDQTRPGAPSEWERFIFYRGLGEAPLPVEVGARGGDITVRTSTTAVQHVYILRVEGGRGTYEYVPAIDAGEQLSRVVPAMDAALPMDRFAARLAEDLAAKLTESGLYEKEARAMVNTWRSSYFTTDGIRVLFVLPQSWTDRYIPLRITPQPAQVIRVMVGRIEVLTPERERRAESAVRDLASPDADVRERAFAYLQAEGRYVEPIVRRTLETTDDERVRTLCRRLLLTDFVTQLRTSLADAASGERLAQDPVYARAQLAALLREIGLEDEARAEGEAALAVLEPMPPPKMSDHVSRHLFRALARASEGAGDDAKALERYGDFVRFGSQAPACGGCHQLEGPRDMAFFRDWWAGRTFGELAQRTGQVGDLIQTHERRLSDSPRDFAARLSLAYLYEASGDRARAERLWAQLDPSGSRSPAP